MQLVITKEFCVTALTGVASVLLDCNATTIHSWSGIGISNKTETQIINKINRSKFYKHNWENTDILIIDEISMMSCKLFELLNKIGQVIRSNKNQLVEFNLFSLGFFPSCHLLKKQFFCF